MNVDAKERDRRRALLKAHLEAEGMGNLTAVLATFATKTEMIYNRQVFVNHEAIREAQRGQ